MEAIKKKMQAMKLEKDNAVDRAEQAEQQARDANMRAEKSEEEVRVLQKKIQQIENELDQVQEDLSQANVKLEEKEKALLTVSLRILSLSSTTGRKLILTQLPFLYRLRPMQLHQTGAFSYSRKTLSVRRSNSRLPPKNSRRPRNRLMKASVCARC